ncbi:plasmid stabilization protein [Glycomyces sp. NPDC047010]|uniref:FitA-like ribbon-helix-helix domain-containing protein n=1 Tax=Glycomyces sp. NPDC047010 TaxID=3155023 RepID=UPI0033DD65BC
MADTKAMSVRGIDPELYKWLKIRAVQHDRSMEAETREILAEAKRVDEAEGNGSVGALFDAFRKETGGVEFDLPERNDLPRAADFSW